MFPISLDVGAWRIDGIFFSETKIDELSRKLDSVCTLLENGSHAGPCRSTALSHLSHSSTSPASIPTLQQSNAADQVSSVSTALDTVGLEYEGDSALSAHAAFASSLLKTVAGKDTSQLASPHRANGFPSRRLPAGLPNLPMPSAKIAFQTLQLLKGMWFLMSVHRRSPIGSSDAKHRGATTSVAMQHRV